MTEEALEQYVLVARQEQEMEICLQHREMQIATVANVVLAKDCAHAVLKRFEAGRHYE